MTLLLLGFNHKTAPVELRECLYLSSDVLKQVLVQLQKKAENVEEIAILSTCNRFEVYTRVSDVNRAKQDIIDFLCDYYSIGEEDLKSHLYIHQSNDVIHHVMSVATGLESMILGESQILGQVSKALQVASEAQTTGAYIHRLFESAIHAGKRARTETGISRQTTSISHAAALLMKEEMLKSDPRVLVLGAGEMAELALYAIHKFGLTHINIVNRTYDTAQKVADKFGAKAHDWSELRTQMQDADVVIVATGADHILLKYDDLESLIQARSRRPILMIDIAMPRNIDPDSNRIEGIDLYDVDDLNYIVDDNLSARKTCIPQVKNIIEEEALRYLNWMTGRSVVPVIKDFRREVSTMVELEVNLALKKMTSISDSDIDVVKHMAHRITNKILHTPTKNLRSHAPDKDAETYANVLRELFALDSNYDNAEIDESA